MARAAVSVAGADFVVAKSTPIVVLAAYESNYLILPRSIAVELSAGVAQFISGGVLQLFIGGGAYDLDIDSTCYGATSSKYWNQPLDLGLLVKDDVLSNPIEVGLKTSDIDTSGGVGAVTIHTAGSGYAVGDTGTITPPGGGVAAEYEVTSIGALGAVTGLSITSIGSKNVVATNKTTSVVTGLGDGLLKVNVTSLTWDGSVKITFRYGLSFV